MLLCFKRRFFFHLPDAFLTHTGGSEDGKKTKSARALDARDAGEDDSDGLDQRDRLEDGDENDDDTAKAPPGFLSPSVREYLELGRSIPGMKKKKPFFFPSSRFVLAKNLTRTRWWSLKKCTSG